MNLVRNIALFDFTDITDFTINEWLLAAATNNHVRMRQMLKEGSVSVNSRHELGWTALHVAAFHGCTELAKLCPLACAGQ